MKAFLLAAGLGTRLRPLTNDIPKCLVSLKGKPLLDYWFSLFAAHGVTEVLVNLHHHAEKVLAFLEASLYPFRIIPFYESTLLGSAGTIHANREWVTDEKSFLIAYADNLTNTNLSAFRRFHLEQDALLTMGLFETNRPKECGIALLDHEKNIVDFTEKPQQPKSTLANAGLYMASPGIFDYFQEDYPQDLGFDILPKLVGQMKGFHIEDYLLDIGNLERYQRAINDIESFKFTQGGLK